MANSSNTYIVHNALDFSCKKIRSKLESHFRRELKSWISKYLGLLSSLFLPAKRNFMIQPIKGLGFN